MAEADAWGHRGGVELSGDPRRHDALAWLGLPAKAFAPTDLDGALAFVDVSPEHRIEARAALERLRRTLRIRRAGITRSG